MSRARAKRPTKDRGSRDRQPLRDAVASFLRVLAGSGYTLDDVISENRRAARSIHFKEARPTAAEVACFLEAPHVLTYWHTDPDFLAPDGAPRPLTLRGARDSLEQLAARVTSAVTPSDLVMHLLEYRAVRKRGNKYMPASRALSYRGHPRGQHLHGLLVLKGMLRNVEHNVSVGRRAPTWFEFVADNAQISASQSQRIQHRIQEVGMPMLNSIDSAMRQAEDESRGRSRRRVALGVYFFEELQPTRRRRR